MFINLSNHPYEKWNQKQLDMAKQYGDIVNIPFPAISPYASSDDIDHLVAEYEKKIKQYDDPVVMLQGEYIFTYRLVSRLKKEDIKVLASCSDRRTIEYIDDEGYTKRESVFEFVEFKEY